MFTCTNCGNIIDPNDIFCANCGERINNLGLDDSKSQNFDVSDLLDPNQVNDDDLELTKDFIEESTNKPNAFKNLPKEKRRRTKFLTSVLILNYCILGLIGVLTIYSFFVNSTVGVLLIFVVAYGILLVKWVQDYSNTGRKILVTIIIIEILVSIFFINFVVLAIGIYQIYVLMLDPNTVSLFTENNKELFLGEKFF